MRIYRKAARLLSTKKFDQKNGSGRGSIPSPEEVSSLLAQSNNLSPHYSFFFIREVSMGQDIRIKPIGIVEKAGEVSEIRVFPEYHEGLTAIGDYEKLVILFWMHLQDNEKGKTRLMSSRPRYGKEGFRGSLLLIVLIVLTLLV